MRQDPASAELTRDAGSPCEQRQLSRFDELAFVMFAVILGTVRNQGQPMPAHVDPITRAVVQHRLSAIVAEMGEAMLRTSYSQILNSSRDFSLAICDVQAR